LRAAGTSPFLFFLIEPAPFPIPEIPFFAIDEAEVRKMGTLRMES